MEYFYAQLHELLTQYGELFEVWFDGANGGDGWYGGTKEERTIDRKTYYNFPRAWKMVAELQPKAVIFSDEGPGCRWVGNEKGFAFATNWAFLRSRMCILATSATGNCSKAMPTATLGACGMRRQYPSRMVLPRKGGRKGEDGGPTGRSLLPQRGP